MQSYPCPCCHRPMESDLKAVDLNKYIPLTKSEGEILDCLVSGAGRVITFEFLAERLWGGRADGGPLTWIDVIKVHVCSLRKKIVGLGWQINSIPKIGFRLELKP